ncbi:hypothetical protein OG799_18765 [Micromonospora sp. NBC_00898]|uniref:hypothetical protein n=1 Tax=Micromonospora sp. NBC_00898 TaxID=2975981 RepID=UPI00386D6518|nr:hypothetical protein OG799_18765 [Micromonospora sp. NBC_00898]
MAESLDDLEARIDELRTAVRRALVAGGRDEARRQRSELRQAEAQWDEALLAIEPEEPPSPSRTEPQDAGPLVPIRDQVYQALTFLSVPAAPKLIVALHQAVFAGSLNGQQLTSLRRDEERSFKTAPWARPYYVCAALTADRFSPARGLLAVSTWPLATRVVGPLSPRVHFLTSAIRIAEHLAHPDWATLPARRLLWQFAANVPGGAPSFASMRPDAVRRAAQAELDVHLDADLSHREAAARRAVDQLDDRHQLFGADLKMAPQAASDT